MIDTINQLLFACGWTPQQYQKRVAEAMRNEEQFSIACDNN